MEEASIIFLPSPRSFKAGVFNIDPSILLPVEASSPPEELSLEMILSGMLKVISSPAGCIENGKAPSRRARIKNGEVFIRGKTVLPLGWKDYYRSFILTAKPEIYHELSGASIVKAANGDFDMALEISEILEGLLPGSSGVLLNKALILENKAAAIEKNGKDASDDYQRALDAYEKALSMEPVLPDALFNAGFFFMRLGDFARARDLFSLYISGGEESEISPEKMKQARKILHDIKSQGLDDNSFQEAYTCVNSGNDKEGLKKARTFIEMHPTVWNGWFVLGWALRKLGRYEDGLEALKKAIELGGSSSDIKNEMAICLMETGDLLGARKELESALREEPENVKIVSNLGVLAQKRGREDEAAAFFRTVLELDPNDPLAQYFFKKNSFD